MKIIYKYEIPIIGYPKIDLPKGAEILDFQTQNNMLVIWALVDVIPSIDQIVIKEAREFAIYGTGQAIAEDLQNFKYIGTTQQSTNPPLVWHLFEKIRRKK